MKLHNYDFTKEEAIVNTVMYRVRHGEHYTAFMFVNYGDYNALVNELGAKALFVNIRFYKSDFDYDGVQVSTPIGRVTVLPTTEIDPGFAKFIDNEKPLPKLLTPISEAKLTNQVLE